MYRLLGLNLFLVCLLALTANSGCGRKSEVPKVDPLVGECELTLLLPEANDPYESSPERVTTMTIDGRDFTDPKHPVQRKLKVTPAAGKNTVTVVYSYWPNNYTNIIRTKVVKVAPGKSVQADLNKEDPASPDKIKPIYFPTPTAVVEAMCRLGKVGKGDVVYDIGCGDGRLVIMAVQKFAAQKGVGIDIDPSLLEQCRDNARKAGVADKTEFRQEDAMKIKDLSEANVVLLYLGDDLNLKIRPILKKTLKPGSRVVSHRFEMGDWKPEVTKKINAKNNYATDEDYVLLLWTIK